MAQPKTKALKLLLALLLSFICVIPVNSFPAESVAADSAADTITAQHGIFQIISYRHPTSHTFWVHAQQLFVYRDMLCKYLIYPLPVGYVCFLFLIQIRRKWLFLMPLKYVSKFVINPLQGHDYTLERGRNDDEIYQRGKRNDFAHRKGTEGIRHLAGCCRNRHVHRQELVRVNSPFMQHSLLQGQGVFLFSLRSSEPLLPVGLIKKNTTLESG